ncbi:hypothetical protein A5320_10875 [Rheinheimera sp. SA_1]|uniref:O-antigen ligase family protein n=1 Tax=Rheinheimera sp. SA_1 TaxID=1827365 RepID=UPI0007FE2358|nr:O-antigen ligase family protein [Rheinheimera sp. SA_1]OBP14290.1 hypothetical protein A5320_10875 [Rheinheimera sp. SA_1]
MKLSFIEPGGWVAQIDELAVLSSVLFFLLFHKMLIYRIKSLRQPFMMFGAYLLISIVSSIFGVVVLNQFLLQFSLDLKPFIIIVLLCLCYDDFAVTRFEKLIKAIILINVPFVLWQFLFSNSYDVIFANGSHFGLVYGADGSEYSRAAGAFWFTGIYAVFCSLAIGFFASKLMIEKKLIAADWGFFFTAILLLFVSLSRGEIVSCLISCVAVYFFYSGTRYVKPITLIAVLAVLIVVLILSSAEIEKWLVELGLISGSIDLAPRAIFMQSALDISTDYFPFGAGLGSFGGRAAVDYDSVFFYKYLISHEWYFNFGFFLTDTFWPKVIAESGYIGTFLYFFGFLFFLRKATERKNLSSVYSLFAIVFILINSLSAPVLNDAFSIAFVFFLFYGSCLKSASR